MASVQSLLAKLRRPSTAADSDRMLLARFAAMDDESAFAQIVERHGPLVLGVCRRTIRDAQLAEDAFQATFFVLAKTAHRVSVKESLANWLYVVARRIAVKAARRRQSNPVLEATDEIEAREDRSDLVRVFDEELERLPAKYRSPLIAFHLQDRTQDETAELLGLSLSTVRRRLDAGRERLRLRLAARGVSLGVVASVALPPALSAQTVALAVALRSGAAVGPQLQPLLHEGLRMGTNYWKLGGILAVAAVAVGVAVSHGDEKPTENPRKLIAGPAAVAKWSTIKGRVVWPGTAAAVIPVAVNADKEHCLSKGALEPDDFVVNKKNGGLKNVWVYLRPDDNDRDAAFKPAEIHANFANPKSKEYEVDQPCCQFVPRVLAVRVGDTVKFKNSSPIPHNVKYTANASIPEFNVTLPSGQTQTTPAFKPDRMPNSFECNVHPWMKGQVLVFDHPYFALTDADGNFEIKNAPVGKFRIVYRHERGYHKGRDGNKGFPLEISGPTLDLDPLKYEEPSAK